MIIYKEIIGIIATLFIVVAFSLKGELKIRILDTVGAIIFIVYGSLINSVSVVVLNSLLVIIQLYHIYKLSKVYKSKKLTKQQKEDLVKFQTFLTKLSKDINESEKKYLVINNHVVELATNVKGEEMFVIYDNKLKTNDYKKQRILTHKEAMNFLLEAAEIDFKY